MFQNKKIITNLLRQFHLNFLIQQYSELSSNTREYKY